MCRQHERKPPAVNGIDVALLETWAAQQQGKGHPLDSAGAFGAALLGGQDSGFDADPDHAGNMVSAKEERDLQMLLEMFAMGVGDVEQFQLRLQDELAALEVVTPPACELIASVACTWQLNELMALATWPALQCHAK